MPHKKALLDRLAAPVDYGPIRPWIQRVRAVASAAVATACAAGLVTGIDMAWLPGTTAAIVALHAVTRGRRVASITESLMVDALTLTVGLSVADHFDQVLVAASAYFIAVSAILGGFRVATRVVTVFGAAVAILTFGPVPHPEALPPAAEIILWITVAMLLVGVAVSLGAALSAVADARVYQAQALEAERRAGDIKSEFVSMVTHELRTPLTNIAGFAMTMRESWHDLSPEEMEEFLRIIVGEADHLANLVDDVLAIPRLQAGRLLIEAADFPLRPAAFRITDLIFPAGGEKSASVAVSGRVRLHADPNRVEQVLRNLLENARKYGGTEVQVDATPLGNEWIVVVADNGPGVPPEHRERIFGTFEQVTGGDARTDSGFGLGLAVARHLVEAMGGRIWYEPAFPLGSRFCFSLPAAAEHAVTHEAVA